MNRPLCFVLMPFGIKSLASGTSIDFDEIYHQLIAPAIEAADLEPLRADEEMAGGIIHKPMYERLILCEYAVADLTTANANVFYELGLRHAVRPSSTVLIFAEGSGQLPFDVAPLRAIPYGLGVNGKPSNAKNDQSVLSKRLLAARQVSTDSPIYQLVEGFPDIQHLKTDVFRDRVSYSTQVKKRLAQARKKDVTALDAIKNELNPIADVEAGVVVDLFLSYRAVKAWQNMIDLVNEMPSPLATTVMIQEQLGLALNRAGRSDEAEKVLLDLIQRRGPSSETYGILGRVYKDRWEAAEKVGKELQACGLLKKAIEAYLKGFESDWRDAYPGINTVTLMELKDPPDERKEALIPIVSYSVDRRIAMGEPDYWDYATRLELAVLATEKEIAIDSLTNALAMVREAFQPETTARNLRLIRKARERRNDDKTSAWIKDIEDELQRS